MPGPADVVDRLRAAGVGRGDPVALVVPDGSDDPGRSAGLAVGPGPDECLAISGPEVVDTVDAVERDLGPRWGLWSSTTARTLATAGVRLGRSWDVAAVHRLLRGGWRSEPARVWAVLHGLSVEGIPTTGPADLFGQVDDDVDPASPVGPDGHLKAGWVDGGWADTPDRAAAWAGVLAQVVDLQRTAVDDVAVHDDRPMAPGTARAESTAELLCAELAVDGLPVDRDVADALLVAAIGPRPRSDAEAAALRAERDARGPATSCPSTSGSTCAAPPRCAPCCGWWGSRCPTPGPGAWSRLRDAHPLVDALLVWRKAERIQTTFGYGWLDEHLGADGRLRGEWSASDGAAGRMTASAGLHNMPADLRPMVVAEPGHVFVRADLGQIEPRVLAVVSGDAALARASAADDLYAPVAAELGVDRATAKVAVLGAMYGQTTGHGAQALRGLQRSYPVAMAYLDAADRAAQVGTDLRTYGGRLVRMGGPDAGGVDGAADAAADGAARSRAAARAATGATPWCRARPPSCSRCGR